MKYSISKILNLIIGVATLLSVAILVGIKFSLIQTGLIYLFLYLLIPLILILYLVVVFIQIRKGKYMEILKQTIYVILIAGLIIITKYLLD